MTDGRKISVFQLYTIFSVSRVTAFFTFIAPRSASFTPGDRFILFIPFCIFSVLFSLPVFAVTKNGGSITALSREISPAFAKTIAVIYAAAILWNAGVSTAKFEFFMTTAMFSGALLLPFTAILLLFCAYIGAKGIQTVGRCCVILSAGLLVSVAAIVAATAKDFDVCDLTRPLGDGICPVIKNGFAAAARTPETAALLFLLPEVNGKAKKGFVPWLILFGLFASGVLGFIAGVTGKYGDGQTFQLYTLTQLAKFGPFEKADDLLTGLWVLCSMFRNAFYIALASKTVNETFFRKNKFLTYIFSAAVVLFFCFLLSKSVGVLSGTLASGMNELLFVLLTAVVPLAVYTTLRIKKHRTKARGNSEA